MGGKLIPMKKMIPQAMLDKFFEGCATSEERMDKLIMACLNHPPIPMKKPKPPKGDLGKSSRYAFFTVRFLDTK